MATVGIKGLRCELRIGLQFNFFLSRSAISIYMCAILHINYVCPSAFDRFCSHKALSWIDIITVDT